MSTSHEQGAVFYVVSRSGKVLGSEDYTGTLVEGDYFEQELEGWIFWGSKKRWAASHPFAKQQDATSSAGGIVGRGTTGNQFDSLGLVSWTTRIPFVVWGDESEALNDDFEPMSWRQAWLQGKKYNAKREPIQGWKNVRRWKDTDAMSGTSWPGFVQPELLFHADRWYRTEKNFKIGLSQLAVLRKWEPGSRELAARWAAWLLRMLRKSRPRQLQHLLFTMCSAVLPVICYSLVRQQWATVLDEELCRCVDIVWNALDKSNACFSPAQWEILEERLSECRQLRMKVGGVGDEDSQKAVPRDIAESCEGQLRDHLSSKVRTPPCVLLKDEEMSNVLVQVEGVPALVKRALREKVIEPESNDDEWKGAAGPFGTPGTIVSLICPINGNRVKVPARGRGCTHPTSFDLDTYLEGHVNKDAKYNIGRQQKKVKKEGGGGGGGWRCPICGLDATWPQIVVDKLLLRIVKVLPEHMSQVCLLPNGRWRVVSSACEDPSKIESNSTKARDSMSTSDIYHIGLFGELSLDARESDGGAANQEESFGCDAVHFLNRAYTSWNGGADNVAKGSNLKKIELQWSTQSTHAVWTGDWHQNSMTDYWGRADPHNMLSLEEPGQEKRVRSPNAKFWGQASPRLYLEEPLQRTRQDTGSAREASMLHLEERGRETSHKSGDSKPQANVPLCEVAVNLSEVGNVSAVKIDAADGNGADEAMQVEAPCDDTERAAGDAMVLDSLLSLGGIPSVKDRTWGVYKRKLRGHTKARPKLMAKKL